MAQWTHVNGSIRFDYIHSKSDLPKDKDFSQLSELGIEYKISRNTFPRCLAAMAVVFYGDLIHYDNANELIENFKRITHKRFVRSGILEIEVEFQKTQVYKYDTDKEQWVKIFENKYDPKTQL